MIELENEVKEQAKRIKDLESQITTIRQERDKLKTNIEEMTTEQEEERKLVQEVNKANIFYFTQISLILSSI